jgi:competence protein ComEA
MRIGVGAAVVLLIVALATAVVLSAVGGQATRQVITPAGTGRVGSGMSGAGAASGAAGEGAAPPGAASADPTAPTGAIIFVHVLGAVRRPGLFELGAGARVIDAVAAAGGLTEVADPSGANLARRLSDGEQLYLPQLGEVVPVAPQASGTTGQGSGAASGQKVNLNTATAAELDTLPRIGPLIAQRIIDYREANGPFGTVDDLRSVTGIGDKTFDGLKALITT